MVTREVAFNEEEDSADLIEELNEAMRTVIEGVASMDELFVALEKAGFTSNELRRHRWSNLTKSLLAPHGFNMQFVMGLSDDPIDLPDAADKFHELMRLVLDAPDNYIDTSYRAAKANLAMAAEELRLRTLLIQRRQQLLERVQQFSLDDIPPIVGNPELVTPQFFKDPRQQEIVLQAVRQIVIEGEGQFWQVVTLAR